MNHWPEGLELGKATRLPAFDLGSRYGVCDCAQDSADAAAYGAWIGRVSNQLSKEEKKTIDEAIKEANERDEAIKEANERDEAIKEANEREAFQKRFEYHLTPKSIEQSADRKTVVVLWNDRTKTIVRLSENDKDDIDTAFAYALAKKVFGSNTHLKKVVRQKWTIHNPRKDKAHE